MKQRIFVFDSYAMIAYLEGEKGAETVAKILKDALNDRAEILMSVVNWVEIYYIVLREQGENGANLYLKTIDRYPIKIVDADKESTLAAGRIKAFNKLSYADAFAAALSISQKAKLVTGDKEFAKVKPKLNIIWL